MGSVKEEGYTVYDCMNAVGPGWASLVREAWAATVEMGLQVVQVKEKFGRLRVHTSHYHDALAVHLREIENRSAGVCEACGAPGHTASVGAGPLGWLKTLCNDCRTKAELYLRTDGTKYHQMFGD